MEYFLAFYLSGVALAMYRLYRPSYMIIKRMEPANILVQQKVIAFFVMLIGFMIILIPITPALLSDELRKSFCLSFCDAVLNPKDGV
tara:strand:- start:699 stop:959 length:261 start_codon:yes stop_codon:yes gene_type:complete